MEERKTAAIVLGIIALVVIIFTVIMPYINERKTQTLQFRSCTVHFKYHDGYSPNYDIYRVAQSNFALCLCKIYQPGDTAISDRIIKIYKETGNPIGPDTVYKLKNSGVDNIIKYRSKAFDTLILVD